jgi:hypothetical protein
MRVRVFVLKDPDGQDLTIDNGDPLRCASLSFSEAEDYIAETRKLLAEEANTPAEEFLVRNHKLIARQISKAGINCTLEEVKEYDIPTINAIVEQLMEKSGLRTQGRTLGGAPPA